MVLFGVWQDLRVVSIQGSWSSKRVSSRKRSPYPSWSRRSGAPPWSSRSSWRIPCSAAGADEQCFFAGEMVKNNAHINDDHAVWDRTVNMTYLIISWLHTYMHTYMHACMHTYIHAFVHPYTHTSIHPYIHTSMNACIHTYIHIYILYI